MEVLKEVVEKRIEDPRRRLTRLIKYTTGEAKNLIKSPAEGYENAMELLKSRYEDLFKILASQLHEIPCFLFPDVLKRWSFQKNRTGIWSFLYYQERWYFFFPKIWSYSSDTKGKMIFLKKKKKYLEIWYFLRMFWKDGLSKKFVPGRDLFCNIWKDGISFFQKIWYFFFRRKMKEDDLYQKTRGNMMFSVYMGRR